MVLVNAGTNVGQPSGRITAIDPRGGAALIGDNGVGKTSVLRLIPLFFGHPVSQVVNEGQEKATFVAPSLTGAVCFEYQRGSDAPENIRLAVLRRRADADALEYRIFPCGFIPELFLVGGVFADDAATCEAALKMGIAPTNKLTLAEYRTVILKGQPTGRDHKKIRAYAQQHSFGPRELVNLDRLVAAMVKERVNFDELVNVAVGLIQLERGVAEHRQKLTFRQQRSQLEAWLQDRDAAQTALALGPQVTRLNGMVLDHSSFERELRHRRYDVTEMTARRAAEKADVESRLQTMTAAREAQVREEALSLEQLRAKATAARARFDDAHQKHEQEQASARYFEDQKAEHWSGRVEEIPLLESRRTGVGSQLSAATSGATEAQQAYQREEQQCRDDAGRVDAALEQNKAPIRAAYEDEITRIANAERAQEEAIAAQARDAREGLEEALDPLLQNIGKLRHQVANPAAPDALVAAVTEANQKLGNHAGEARRLSSRLQEAMTRSAKASTAFNEAERALHAARARKAILEQELAAVSGRLRPADGSLLATLKAEPSEAWKAHLARVVDPALLLRSDLNAHALADSPADSLYGWHVNTDAIDLPEWANDEALKRAVEEAAKAVETVVGQESALAIKLDAASFERESAERALTELRAAETVHDTQRRQLQEQLAGHEQRLATARTEAKRTAEEALRLAESQERDMLAQRRRIEVDAAAKRAAVRAEHESLRKTAAARRDEAIAGIEASQRRAKTELETRLKDLQAQMNQHLAAKGIDPAAVAKLRDQLQAVIGDINTLTSKLSLVQTWKQWMAAVGPAKLVELREAALRLGAEHAAAAAAVETALEAMRRSQSAHREAEEALRSRLAVVEADLTRLGTMDLLMGDYGREAHDAFDPTLPVETLHQRVREALRNVSTSEREITSLFAELYKDLTAKESSVKHLFERSLADVTGSDIKRAHELCFAHRRLASQVLVNLNNSMRTVLGHIGAFRKSILDFESEVASFNSRLQAALKEVRRFERVDQLQLHIVADFESLQFYGKLKRMDEIARKHQAESGADFNNTMPPVETAEAIRDFLGVLGNDGALEVNLASHISLQGSVVENGKQKPFRSGAQLGHISSTGLTQLILITLLVGLVNTVRRGDPVHVPWITDEVTQFDPGNFASLLHMLAENRIDVITASPKLDMLQFGHFEHRYVCSDRGRIGLYVDPPGHTRPRSPARSADQDQGVEA